MRVVLDTNIAVAGLLWRGKPYDLLGLAVADRIRCFASEAMIAELGRVLHYARLSQRLGVLGSSPEQLVADYRELVELVAVTDVPRVVRTDPDDDAILACALAAGADAVVSGDRHLLDLKIHEGIPIITAASALARAEEI